MKQDIKAIQNPHSKNFPTHSAPEFNRAIKALSKLGEAAGVDACADAYAAATSDLWAAHFSEVELVTLMKGNLCIQRLLGKKCQQRTGYCPCTPPANQHASMWEREGEPRYFVSEFYALEISGLENNLAFAKKHGLGLEIVAQKGSHFPGKCFSIIYWNLEIPRWK